MRRRSRRDGWGWGQLAAEDFWPSRSDSPGRAWVSVVRELELFLLTLRPQTSSGQPPPLPEPLPSSPGEEKSLQPHRLWGPQVQHPTVWAPPTPSATSSTLTPRRLALPGSAKAEWTSWPGLNWAWGHGRRGGHEAQGLGGPPAPFCSWVGLCGTLC